MSRYLHLVTSDTLEKREQKSSRASERTARYASQHCRDRGQPGASGVQVENGDTLKHQDLNGGLIYKFGYVSAHASVCGEVIMIQMRAN